MPKNDGATTHLQVGDWIRLRKGVNYGPIPDDRENNESARIHCFLPDIAGGIHTDRDLRGMRYWNVSHVERAEPGAQ